MTNCLFKRERVELQCANLRQNEHVEGLFVLYPLRALNVCVGVGRTLWCRHYDASKLSRDPTYTLVCRPIDKITILKFSFSVNKLIFNHLLRKSLHSSALTFTIDYVSGITY